MTFVDHQSKMQAVRWVRRITRECNRASKNIGIKVERFGQEGHQGNGMTLSGMVGIEVKMNDHGFVRSRQPDDSVRTDEACWLYHKWGWVQIESIEMISLNTCVGAKHEDLPCFL
jgi:hypothetical protein